MFQYVSELDLMYEPNPDSSLFLIIPSARRDLSVLAGMVETLHRLRRSQASKKLLSTSISQPITRDCLLAYYISGRASCRLGSGGR